VLALHRSGHTAVHIARELGLGRKTVGRYLRAGGFPEPARPRRRPSLLDPFEPYLRGRWAAGCHNAQQLWRELRQRGFQGAASHVRSHVAVWRPEPGCSGPPPRRAPSTPCTAPPPAPLRVPSPRQARWLLLHPADRLTAEEQSYGEQLLQADDEVRSAHALAAEFGLLVRERRRDGLDAWLQRAEASGIDEFVQFALVMRRDHAAVAAALTSEWSNGQTEGQITRLKSLKRQMYGRAGFGLLKRCLLHTA